jgi:hypothetical protein
MIKPATAAMEIGAMRPSLRSGDLGLLSVMLGQ